MSDKVDWIKLVARLLGTILFLTCAAFVLRYAVPGLDYTRAFAFCALGDCAIERLSRRKP